MPNPFLLLYQGFRKKLSALRSKLQALSSTLHAPRSTLQVLMLLSNAFAPDPRVHREAAALVESGFQVKILCWDRDKKASPFERIDGIDVERVYVKSTHGRGITQIFFLYFFWLAAFFRLIREKYDVVHAHDFDTLPLGYLAARLKSARLVYDSHESYIDMLHHFPRAFRWFMEKAENFFLKRADLVITVGDILEKHLQDRGAIRTCVVGNWQDPGKFVFDEEKLSAERSRLGVADNQSVIVFIANLGKERQLPPLIEAVKENPDVFLLLGGDGPCRQMAEEAAAAFKNIFYLGYVPPAKIPLYTALSDMVYYGFDPLNPNARFSAPNKLFEALAAGKPVMTADFGEIGRIVKESQCGVILPGYSVSAITAALTALNQEKRNEFSANAKTAGSLYSWRKAKDILTSSYRAII